MAWQSPSPMAGGGGFAGPGGDGSPNGGQPHGTEYTLQGVMRFLQTEWHRHERDRNAWEIERAEMKSRIGRLEGDVRTGKRLNESLGKHVRLLEAALKKEREKVKKLSNNEKVEDTRDAKEIARESLNAIKSQRPKFPIDVGDNDASAENHPDFRQESERDKSRLYLSKASQEITYHVIPSSQPPLDLSDQDLSNHVYGGQQLPQQSLEEAYIQQQRQKQQQQQANHMMAREVALQNHQPMAPPYGENQAMNRSMNRFGIHPAPRDGLERRPLEAQPPAASVENRRHSIETGPPDGGAAEESQMFEGHAAPGGKGDMTTQPTEDQSDDTDGWNFDEPEQEPPTEPMPPHRPDVDAFPNANFPKSPQRSAALSHRRKSSGARRKSEGATDMAGEDAKQNSHFNVRFVLRGHLDVVRAVIFTGGGSPSEPEICTCSDDGTIKRWTIPATFGNFGPHGPNSDNNLDITSYFTHRGHTGAVTALAACSPQQNFSNGGRATGDGWVFSGGQDASVRVWERGRVDPKATLDGHTDAVWGLCVLPGTAGSIFGDDCSHYGGPDRILLASGGADGHILIWAVSAPPQLSSPQAGSRRAGGSRRANSISSGSNFPSSPQPSIATTTPFHYSLVRKIVRTESPSPTCISPLSLAGINFVVSYTDASILVYDTRTGEEIVGMASLETYDGTPSTGVNSVVTSTIGFDGSANLDPARQMAEEEVVHGATGSSGVEGVIISGYEDKHIRLFDANSGQCTYAMLAHTAPIASLSLSPDGRELVSAGHDASLRFWDLEKRNCSQEMTSHRPMRGEGITSAVWSRDGRWVVSGGGDGIVKVFSR
ncbi:striatin Pro11 [Aspergillus campestris IBT 28561]|uniref:Striatin Pro11 n=1 Tax=Aspergillus campestris (strain IBT 28561) TaxID=1392248 RepID=A0A2I1DFI3_ASPC2|nr:striatin Pro11 [Aspergillus campestris IBT 28561]PKY08636.1 striatin Pro11 [Aspergillus campestris IBT 28561]